MKMKRVALIGSNPFSGNRGVGALAYSAIWLIERAVEGTSIQIEFYLNALHKEEYVQIEGSLYTLHPLEIPYLKGLFSIVRTIYHWRSLLDVLSIDYVLDVSEGDSFSDIYGIERFNAINRPKHFFNLIGKRQILLPQTIGPFEDPAVRRTATTSMRKIECICVRDTLSSKCVKELLPNKKVILLIDMAFYMPYERVSFPSDSVNVGINISALLWNGGYNRNNQFKLKTDYKALIRHAIQYFLGQDNIRLYLIPHVLLDRSNIENDYEVSSELLREYNSTRLILAPFFINPIEAKSYISGLDFFMGARMHACIAAFSSGVPVFPVSYSRKFFGLFRDSLGYQHLGDLTCVTADEALQEMKKTFVARESIKEEIDSIKKVVINPLYEELMMELKRFLAI